MPLHLVPGAVPVAGYTLVRRLGRGGFGEVWEATAPGGVPVALKFIPIDTDQAVPERRALELIRAIRHPHLLDVQFAVLAEDYLVIAMPLCDESLMDRLEACRREGRIGLPRPELLVYMEEIARAVDFLNEPRHKVGEGGAAVGVQHRDVKPQNIFLVGGSARLADFGLAKILDASQGSHSGSLTPSYVAPEALENRVSRYSDQYSLAATYLHLRAGHPPFAGTINAIMLGHLQRPPDLSGLDGDERAAVARALAKRPEERWPNCVAFVRALQVAPRTDDARDPTKVAGPRPSASASPAFAIGAAVQRVLGELGQALKARQPKKAPVAPPPPTEPAERAPRPSKKPARPRRLVACLSCGVIVLFLAVVGLAAILVVEREPDFRKLESELRKIQSGFDKTEEPVTKIAEARPRVEAKAPESPPPPPPFAPSFTPRKLGSPSSSFRTITNAVGMTLVLIPAGEFLMGAADSDAEAFPYEKPRHRVTISRPFYLGETEVTQGEYRAVIGANPSAFPGSDDLPVEMVSWNDAIAFCNALSKRDGLKPYYRFGAGERSGGDGYRLPTEAEWEYACRAGSTGKYSFGDDPARLGEYAWYLPNSAEKTHPVGQKRPNAFGLFDMHGNVLEWCWDGFDDYPSTRVVDPVGPSKATVRVLRGGYWQSIPRGVWSTFRLWKAPELRFNNLGLRVARNPSGR